MGDGNQHRVLDAAQPDEARVAGANFLVAGEKGEQLVDEFAEGMVIAARQQLLARHRQRQGALLAALAGAGSPLPRFAG